MKLSGAVDLRTFRSRIALLVMAALFLGFATGCGSDNGNGGASAPAAASQDSTPVEVRTGSGDFDPGKIYSDTIDGVVSVRTIYDRGNEALGARGAGGSGFVLNGDGEVITNAHVISEETGSGWKPAGEVFVEFSTGDILPARVVGVDLFSDVGLLRVDPAKIDLTPLKLADSDRVAVGEPIAVIGSPFGEDQTLTTGIVSQVKRSVRSLTEFEIQDAIQTDASINPGNSGGPMLDRDGKVIAISQQMKTGSGSSNGVGFGVPANTIDRSADQLREHGKPSYAYIGVSTQPLYPQLAEKLGIGVDRGAIVGKVLPGGPAAEAGIKGGTREIAFQGVGFSAGGDVITEVDGQKIERPEDLGRVIAALSPGDTVAVEVVRDGKRRTIEVKLAERPETIDAG